MKTIKRLPLSALVLSISSVVASSAVLADDDFNFTGYGRLGMAYQTADETAVSPEGAYNGSSTMGRLGNEGPGGEIQFNKAFEGENGSQWDIVIMAENWGGSTFNNKKFYAGGKNLFESQPDMYVWAGRNFNQRPQQGLNDYAWMTHDGQGAGFQNMDLGFAQLDLSFVGQADGLADSGYYAVTSKLAGIAAGPASIDLYFNYGFQNDEVITTDTIDAYQIGSQINTALGKVTLRYSANSDDTVLYSWNTGLKDETTNIYASFESGVNVNDNISVDYLLAYHNRNDDNDDSNTRVNYSGIVRPMIAWDDVHSTWLEAGYTMVDYTEIDSTNTAWKFTASQNLAIGKGAGARPMLRFYTTVGNEDNESTSTESDILTVGAMFEAWW
ncbi:carbohydrate porin [Reinekea thalattae]|uniref:Carbohydrate porin n=1 Tax=Reinekea thalattae TaxID=2593301 RepID=A0A5C8Z4X9_9GAMM|nr:carbohydrate porin [Reinekea thalattae]TXR51966.1 carbohydrate porin [Reinekea thalattae]